MYDFFARYLPSFHTAYLTDWTIAWVLFILASVINSMPVFERYFTVDDSVIKYPHTKQRVNGILLHNVSFYLPLLVVAIIGGLKRSWIHVHHGILGLFLAVASQWFIVSALKNRVGRLRPDFLARCKWDAFSQACTGDLKAIRDGRRSFPSGHSSLAFAGLTFLSLRLASCLLTTKADSASSRVPYFLESKPLRLVVSLFPLGVATWIAVTRLEDYRHHVEDVLIGAVIGAGCACVSHTIYWPSPFSGNTEPRTVYASGISAQRSGYELAYLDENANNV